MIATLALALAGASLGPAAQAMLDDGRCRWTADKDGVIRIAANYDLSRAVNAPPLAMITQSSGCAAFDALLVEQLQDEGPMQSGQDASTSGTVGVEVKLPRRVSSHAQ